MKYFLYYDYSLDSDCVEFREANDRSCIIWEGDRPELLLRYSKWGNNSGDSQTWSYNPHNEFALISRTTGEKLLMRDIPSNTLKMIRAYYHIVSLASGEVDDLEIDTIVDSVNSDDRIRILGQEALRRS